MGKINLAVEFLCDSVDALVELFVEVGRNSESEIPKPDYMQRSGFEQEAGINA
jgi:hypothetical protein